MKPTIQITPKDNVAVALKALHPSEQIEVADRIIPILQDIPAGHKFSIQEIEQGASVIKYGNPIGTAQETIPAGSWVHTHNIKTQLSGMLDYSYNPQFEDPIPVPPQTFLGYLRPDGSVGIRNEIWIIPTVGCVNAIAKAIEDQAKQSCSVPDGIFSYSHPYGCSQLGDDQLYTQKALCGLIRHPNAGGVLVLGLGCENNNIAELKKILGDYDENRVKFLVCQDCEDELSVGVNLVQELSVFARQFHRTPLPASQLIVGLKCGGSDGFSGVTANPLTGAFCDILTAQRGTAIMTEVPEMFGAEQLLMNRCRTKEIFQKTVSLINDFKRYFLRYGQQIDENPSPGNKEGGISTLEDKSLGCVQKAGLSPIEDVLDYGQPVLHHGLNLLQAPGNDLVASCALAASGAQLVLFTTGRGTPFGCPVPTIKVSSNSELAKHKPHWIDFDAGRLLQNSDPSLPQEFFDYVLTVASGEQKAKSESLDKRDLSIFKDGVTL